MSSLSAVAVPGVAPVVELIAGLQRVRLHQPGGPASRPSPIVRRVPVDRQASSAETGRCGQSPTDRRRAANTSAQRFDRLEGEAVSVPRRQAGWAFGQMAAVDPSRSYRSAATLAESGPSTPATLQSHQFRQNSTANRAFKRGVTKSRKARSFSGRYSPDARTRLSGSISRLKSGNTETRVPSRKSDAT
jgi:hypothetical protein